MRTNWIVLAAVAGTVACSGSEAKASPEKGKVPVSGAGAQHAKETPPATGSAPDADVTPMVLVPAGKFLRCRKCPKKRQVEVETSAFQIDKDEVTQGQYAECVKAKRCSAASPAPKKMAMDEPVRGVSWNDADAYCRSVGKRLPTEAEWARAAFPSDGTTSDYGPRLGSREPCKVLLIGGYGGEKCPGGPFHGPNNVALKLLAWGQNEVGDRVIADGAPEIFDLYGNVAEWVFDWEALPGNLEYYLTPQTRTNPRGPVTGSERVIRGGSFAELDGSAEGDRRSSAPGERPIDVGFRCAADVK